MAFEVAIYTDVLASEAIDGIDGFNFQAASPGISGTDRQRIRESLLHRVVPSWSLEHDDLSHPSTCAYVVADGRAYLSRGGSTGKTNSGRPGNQLTQVIVTSDLDDFVPYRPAQLFGARNWRLEKAPSSRIIPWATPLEVRPEFEATALREYVLADEWAAEVLPRFLTMIDQTLGADPTKLVILHPDLDVVMRWIALGTLFVDAEDARALQFRALVDDPRRVNAPIVGVSPQFRVADFGAANVFDLAGRTTPAISPSAAAGIRASWFLERDVDDALNAVAIARRWEPALGPQLANEAARVVGMREDGGEGRAAWRTAVATVEKLARAGLTDDLVLYADELCEAAVSFAPTSEEEFRLVGTAVRRAHDVGVDEVASGLVVPAMEALAAVPGAVRGFAEALAEPGPPITWQSADARAAAGAFLSELLAKAPFPVLPDLFATARIIGAPVPEARLAASVATLAELWLRDPALGHGRWQTWLAGESVLSATGRKLVDALRAGDAQALASLLRGDWDFLAQLPAEPDVLGWVRAGQLGRIAPGAREYHLARGGALPAEAWRVALAGSTLPAHADLWTCWISRHGLAEDLAAHLRSLIERQGGTGPTEAVAPATGDWGPLIRCLAAAQDPWLARFSQDFEQARAAIEKASNDLRTRPAVPLDGALPAVRAFAPFLLTDIGRILLRSTNDEAVARLLAAAGPHGPEAVRAYLDWLVRTERGLRAIDYALGARGHRFEEIAGPAEDVLDQIIESQPALVQRARLDWTRQQGLDAYLRQRDGSRATRHKRRWPFGRRKEN
ncbi:MAG: hypothetical protein IRZ08_06885 [Frankia sp.]|nr:hypothetical protein [Frankia sp.]